MSGRALEFALSTGSALVVIFISDDSDRLAVLVNKDEEDAILVSVTRNDSPRRFTRKLRHYIFFLFSLQIGKLAYSMVRCRLEPQYVVM